MAELFPLGPQLNMSRGRSIAPVWMLLATLAVAPDVSAPGAAGRESARYEELLRAERLLNRLARYRSSRAYLAISRVIGVDPLRRKQTRLHTKCEALIKSLYEAGDLVFVSFWIPNLGARMPQVEQQLDVIARDSFDQYPLWTTPSGDVVTALCRRDVVASARTAFWCDITNRVAKEDLRRLSRSRDEVDCRIGDDAKADLDGCQEWLNDSIADGWMVGVTFQSDWAGHEVLVATRRRSGAETQRVAAGNDAQPASSRKAP